MRVMMVSQDFPPDLGGIQTYSMEIAKRLAGRLSYFGVVAPWRPGAKEADRDLDFEVFRLWSRADHLTIPALFSLPRLVRRHKVDVTFHTQWPTVAAALRARRLTGYPKRIIVACHGRELLLQPFPISAANRYYSRLRRTMLKAADHCLAVSNYTQDLLVGLGVAKEDSTVIPLGADPGFFKPQDAHTFSKEHGISGSKVVLTVSRLVPRKGVDTVIEALPRLLAHVDDLTYVVAGEGPDRRRLEGLATALGVREQVLFLGSVPQDRLNELYNACDVFVMPARHEEPDVEGYGMVFHEANACGKPVVGSRAGGISDAVLHGRTGLLVEPGDSSGLAETLRGLLENEEEALTLGSQGLQYVRTVANWATVADNVFKELANGQLGMTPVKDEEPALEDELA